MANYEGYYRCDLTFVKDTNSGGRIYSAQNDKVLPNGVIGVLGATLEDKPEVKEFKVGAVNGKTLYIVMKPEINYDEQWKDSGALGKFRNPAKKPFPAIRLQERDRVTFSEDYFVGASDIEVGNVFKVNSDGLLTLGAGSAGDYTFVVTEVKRSAVPNYLAYDEAGAYLAPQPYKLVTVEVIMAE